jgi:poly(beta-D-mannuronate) lyase
MKIFAVMFLFVMLVVPFAQAQPVFVNNAGELKTANKNARPGDVVILKNGEWNNVDIRLDGRGTKEQPIIFRAETAGKVVITGKSSLRLGGDYITVDGLYFTKGHAGDDPVINFRVNKDQLANNCRVTNTMINDFNNPERMEENYWVSFYGKNNRLDHSSFFNKKNMGVLLAVILDDERSRENFHSIDHNYFGFRLPLASNSGEIIRVGVSQHCEFNSNTQITDNFFEHCDGETEIVSLKSGSNVIRNNLFKECQGAVVLRHGNFNTVENNVFLGNNKQGTGGVRIINKGQWVVNNLFYQCRGTGFRSPLSVMNGVPNSPAFRYVTASDAVIANNSFYDCAPLSFCEGSDTERSEPPFNIQVINNLIYNRKDSNTLFTYDKMDGFHFSGNVVGQDTRQALLPGFRRTSLTIQKANSIFIPLASQKVNNTISDSLQSMAASRIKGRLSVVPGFSNSQAFLQLEANAYRSAGAKWFTKNSLTQHKKTVLVNCASVEEIRQQLDNNNNNNLVINLTAPRYHFTAPLNITSNTGFKSNPNAVTRFSTGTQALPFLIQVKGGSSLVLMHLNLDLRNVKSSAFITTDTSGSSDHSNLEIVNCQVSNYSGNFLYAAKSSLADSITVSANGFTNNKGTLFAFTGETDKKGYYNVELLKITNNTIRNHEGQVLAMLRSGNDESTMGPSVVFSSNIIDNCNTPNKQPLFHLYGTQLSVFSANKFIKSNSTGTILQFEDIVRARHLMRMNNFTNSGTVRANKFVESRGNIGIETE